MGHGPARICLYEREAQGLAPLADVRPVWELRAGSLSIRERWARLFPDAEIVYAGRAELAGVHAARTGGTLAVTVERAGTLFADAGLVPGPADREPIAEACGGACRLVASGGWAGACLPEGPPLAGDADLAARVDDESVRVPERSLETPLLHTLPDFIRRMDRLVRDDATLLAQVLPRETPPREGVHVLGTYPVRIATDAVVDPGTTLDAREGPISIGSGAVVSFNTWLVGPASIGARSRLLGGTIGPIAGIGPVCHVRGELAESFVQGFANKAHDGFIGHSVLGEWVNLGALTTCSDLKNTYSPIRLRIAGRDEETELTKLGVFVGDHAKTAIGSLLSTGSVVGVGANVFGFASLTPKVVPPFAWGTGPAASTDFERFAETAARVMARRGVELDPATREHLAALHAAAS